MQTWIRWSESEEPPAGAGEVWITAGGLVRGGAGWVRAAGAPVPAEEILRRGPAIDELAQRRNALQAEQAEMGETLARLKDELEKLDERHTGEARSLDDLNRRAGVAERRLSEHDLELRILAGERERVAARVRDLEEQVAETQHDLEWLAVRREMLRRRERHADTELQRLRGLVADLEQEREARQGDVGQLRLEAMRWEGTRREVETEAVRLEEELQRLATALEELQEEESRCHLEEEEAARELDRLTREMETLIRDRESRVKHLEEHRGRRTRLQDELMGLEKETRSLRSDLSRVQDTLREREVRLAQIRGEREQVRQGILQEHKLDLDQPLPDPLPWSEEDQQLDEGALESALQELRIKIDQLGPVNLLAISDYDEKKERVGFLRGQRDDLETARNSLLEAIEKINQRARDLFLETFGRVQEHFQGTFESLFPGGEARLVLAEDDPLEADIDIQARPRGKKLESIRLLSTGERTLTATALLFALYLVKPSPFCILDEVDAPLDDANTARFVGMLQHFSDRTQFVLITHNKRTMEAVDVLYGVTMEEPGISKVVSVRLREARALSEVSAKAGVSAPGPGA
ncbi:MAG: AAA family ATPase [Candidatus Eisenbacteria bacterium]|nr:AAA family ATPase [Candidatus Eisenbacteria bacterium]